MEGSRRRREPPVDVEREFARSRLEQQILVRVYELVLPVVRRSLGNPSSHAATGGDDREMSARLTKGA